MGKSPKNAAVYPDLEVVVRRGAEEICTLAFFSDEFGGIDVLVGLQNLNDRPMLASAFRHCADAAEKAILVGGAPDVPAGGLPF